MIRHNGMRVLLTCWACLIMSASSDVPTLPTDYVTAYMDRRERDQQQYGCGDTIRDTLSGEISSIIPPHDPALNCSLTLYSPPGTRLSLTVTNVRLVSHNLGTCDGNRLKILGSDAPGATSLVPSFPNGLCGHNKPNQSVDSDGNRIHLLLESVESTVENQFALSYTSFKTTLDGDCFACDVGDRRSMPFCIDQRLVCDNRKNCPENTEETTANCMVTSPPSGAVNIAIIVIICVLATLFIAVIIFVLLAVIAKSRSKRNRGSVHRRPARVSQSRMMPPSDLAVDLDRGHHPAFPDAPERYETSLEPPLHRGVAPMFTVDGELQGGFPLGGGPDTAGPFPAAPPPYSTLPRPMEQSLQIAENTHPKSRSRLPSVDNEVDPGTP